MRKAWPRDQMFPKPHSTGKPTDIDTVLLDNISKVQLKRCSLKGAEIVGRLRQNKEKLR